MPHEFNVENARSQFPGLARRQQGKPVAFFDGPGGSQVPQRVIDAVADCLAHHNANDGGAFATSREVTAMCDQARRSVADFLGADDPDTIVFGQNMTTLTFALSRSLARTWKPGDEIVVTRLDHDANVSPWRSAAEDMGTKVRFLEIDPADCRLRVDELSRILNGRTKVVAVGVASNAVGTVNPVREIAAAGHRVGALVFLDAVHAAPHLHLDVNELGADFLACSAYKFFGPHVGILWGRRELLEQFHAYKVRPAPDDLPGRWMTGTPNFEGIAGTMAAIDYLADLGTGGTDRVAALKSAYAAIKVHESNLAGRFLTRINQLPNWKVWGITDDRRLDQRVATFGLTHRSRNSKEVAAVLAEHGIFAWAGNFYALELVETLGLMPDGMLRIGFLHYNTIDEVDCLVQALIQIDR